MDTATAIRDRLRALCDERNWAFNHLATESGVPASTVKSIMNGTSGNPGVVTLKKLCDGLGISLTDFFDTETFRSLEQEIR